MCKNIINSTDLLHARIEVTPNKEIVYSPGNLKTYVLGVLNVCKSIVIEKIINLYLSIFNAKYFN